MGWGGDSDNVVKTAKKNQKAPWKSSSVMLGDGGDRYDLLYEERMGEQVSS